MPLLYGFGVSIAAELESPRHEVVLTCLLPDDKQRRTWLVLPPQYIRRPERFHVAVRIAVDRVGVRERLVAAVVVVAPGIDDFLERSVRARRNERLRIELKRE